MDVTWGLSVDGGSYVKLCQAAVDRNQLARVSIAAGRMGTFGSMPLCRSAKAGFSVGSGGCKGERKVQGNVDTSVQSRRPSRPGDERLGLRR